MAKKIAVLIDGGFLRVIAKLAGKVYDPTFIEKVAKGCVGNDEELFRVLYYDCAPYVGRATQPVSGTPHEFKGSDAWLHELAARDFFAVRLGVLKFRGWHPKAIPVGGKPLADSDFSPDFEQKGVDMRIGLDIATLANDRIVDRVVLVTADTDFIPAMKYGRTAGLQVVLAEIPGAKFGKELLAHVDIKRAVGWPT